MIWVVGCRLGISLGTAWCCEFEGEVVNSSDYEFYDGTPPHEDVDTSVLAAHEILEISKTMREAIYLCLLYSDGHTDDEVEKILGMRHQTVSARRRELVLGGRVKESGEYRKTRHGKWAKVWIASGELRR